MLLIRDCALSETAYLGNDPLKLDELSWDFYSRVMARSPRIEYEGVV